MFSIEQVALRSSDIDRDIDRYIQLRHNEWVQDCVHAAHLYVDPTCGLSALLGDDFEVRLAFNYTVIQGQEFELIQPINGRTVQLMDWTPGMPTQFRLSHLGYHVEDQQMDPAMEDTLLAELRRLQEAGGRVLQISQTTMHQNTSRRYRYAFVKGVLPGDQETLVKVIQRLIPPSSPSKLEKSMAEGRELFACLA